MRGPQSLFVGWEPASSPSARPEVSPLRGEGPAGPGAPAVTLWSEAGAVPPWPGASLVLQLYEVQGTEPERERVIARRKVGTDRHWFVTVRGSGRRYRAKIGWRRQGVFHPVAVSSVVATPAKRAAASSPPRSRWQQAMERVVYQLLAESGVAIPSLPVGRFGTSPAPERPAPARPRGKARDGGPLS